VGETEELELLNDLVQQRRNLSRKQGTYQRNSRAQDKNKCEVQKYVLGTEVEEKPVLVAGDKEEQDEVGDLERLFGDGVDCVLVKEEVEGGLMDSSADSKGQVVISVETQEIKLVVTPV